jgi:hypothetical protein
MSTHGEVTEAITAEEYQRVLAAQVGGCSLNCCHDPLLQSVCLHTNPSSLVGALSIAEVHIMFVCHVCRASKTYENRLRTHDLHSEFKFVNPQRIATDTDLLNDRYTQNLRMERRSGRY